MKKVLLTLLLISLLSACANRYEAVRNQSTNVALEDAATSVSKSLVHLARVEQAAHPHKIPLPPTDPELYGMDANATIDWNGPIEPLLQKIANASHYNLEVIGAEPAIPVLVTVNETNVPLATALQDASSQAKARVRVIVFPSTRTIQLTYLKNDEHNS